MSVSCMIDCSLQRAIPHLTSRSSHLHAWAGPVSSALRATVTATPTPLALSPLVHASNLFAATTSIILLYSPTPPLRNYTLIHRPIQVLVTCCASSTNPNSNNNCVVPLTALSNALETHACVTDVCSPTKIVLLCVL